MSIQAFCPFFNQVVWFFDIELYELFIYFGHYRLISHIICKYFLLFYRSSFCLAYILFHSEDKIIINLTLPSPISGHLG